MGESSTVGVGFLGHGGATASSLRRSYSATPAGMLQPLTEDSQIKHSADEDTSSLAAESPRKQEQVLKESTNKRRPMVARLVGYLRSSGVSSNQASPRLPPPVKTMTFDSPENAVILIDWDDTLLPTTFIKQVVLPSLPLIEKGGPVPSDSRFHADLESHAKTVTNMLRAANQAGRVAIVTLATRWWVMTSAEWYFPGFDLEELLEEL